MPCIFYASDFFYSSYGLIFFITNVVQYVVCFKQTFQVLNFITKNTSLHLAKCSTCNAKKIHECTQYFSSYERKHMPPFVVLNI